MILVMHRVLTAWLPSQAHDVCASHLCVGVGLIGDFYTCMQNTAVSLSVATISQILTSLAAWTLKYLLCCLGCAAAH